MHMQKNKIGIFSLLMLSAAMLNAQTPEQVIMVSKPSENAADLGRYGQVPVDLSTGQLSVSVPLYNLSYGNVSIPISLGFNTSGIPVDQHASWVGLGASLNAGGVISRSTRGLPDDYSYPEPWNSAHMGGSGNGYLSGGYKLDVTDWYSNIMNMAKYAAPQDETSTSGSTYYLSDGIPDDFSFNFGGYSGTFFVDEKGIWRVKSKDNQGLTISHQINSAPWILEQQGAVVLAINHLITQFTITTPDGTQYVFGGNVNSIDYSRPTRDDFYATQTTSNIYYNISPSAWYLTKITKPTGEEVVLNYEKGLNVARIGRSWQGSHYGTFYADLTPGSGYSTNSTNFGPTMFGSILTPCYLKEIITPAQKVEFFKSYALQKKYDNMANYEDKTIPSPSSQNRNLLQFYRNFWTNASMGPDVLLRGWPEFHFDKYTNSSLNSRPLTNFEEGFPLHDYSYKLDSIVVNNRVDNTVEKIKTISLGYTNHLDYRLFLQTISIFGKNREDGGKYTLDYFNMGQLPDYTSWKKDQWGYFNNNEYHGEQDKYLSVGRLPNLTYAIYGSLKSIQYPTGGTSSFEYELNNYAKFQNVGFSDPLSTLGAVGLATVGNTDAGGLRIKKVTSTSGYGAPPLVKEYFYNKNYLNGGTTSSGILSKRNDFIEKIRFVNFCTYNGAGYVTTFSDKEFDPHGEDVRLVSYSEITEKDANGGFIVYKYTNYDDPGCLDELGLTPFIFGALESDRYKLTSNDLERGLLKSKESYTSSNVKVEEEIYTYEYASNRKQKYAKAIERKDNTRLKFVSWARNGVNGPCVEQLIYRLYPFLKYYYNIPLKEVTKNIYESTGVIATTKTFTYDEYGSIIKTMEVASDGKRIVQDTRYNSNPDYLNTAISGDAFGVRNLFYNYNIKNYPVEKTTMILPPGPTNVAGSQRISSGTVYKYAQGIPVLRQVLSMELPEPFYPVTYIGNQPTYHYTTSNINPSGDFVFDGRYKVQSSFTNFSTNTAGYPKQPLSISGKDNDYTYTWDHRLQLLTSKTQNAADGKAAFTSFEGEYYSLSSYDDNRGNWNFDKNMVITGGFTGTKHIRLYPGAPNNNIVSTFVLTPGKKYVLSFWVKGRFPSLKNGSVPFGGSLATYNNWKYFEFIVTGSNQPIVLGLESTTLPTDLDEIRLYPADGQMSTYTYNLISGTPSAIGDINGKVSFYEYDGLGRLIHVKDENGNITTKNTYSIQGPQ